MEHAAWLCAETTLETCSLHTRKRARTHTHTTHLSNTWDYFPQQVLPRSTNRVGAVMVRELRSTIENVKNEFHQHLVPLLSVCVCVCLQSCYAPQIPLLSAFYPRVAG